MSLLNFLRSLFYDLDNTAANILQLFQKTNIGMKKLRLRKEICFLRCVKLGTCSDGGVFLLEMCLLTPGFQI